MGNYVVNVETNGHLKNCTIICTYKDIDAFVHIPSGAKNVRINGCEIRRTVPSLLTFIRLWWRNRSECAWTDPYDRLINPN